MGLSIDDDQAYEILKQVIDRHDASTGVSWDTIEYYITESEYYKKKNKENK